jgi:hypothetical protein
MVRECRPPAILLSDLRRYLERAVTGQRPQFFASGDPLISLTPATGVPLLDAATVDKIREVLAACYRRAVFARMHAQMDWGAMFTSLSECRATLQRLIVFVEPTELQSLVANIIGELDSIEHVGNPALRSGHTFSEIMDARQHIDSAKRRIIAALLKLRDAASVSFVLPTSLTEEVFFTSRLPS